MQKPPPYIEASGAELDCGIRISDEEWARGFLRLPDSTDVGRVRFVEDVLGLISPDGGDPLRLFLLDGKAGTPVCLLDYFLTRHSFRMPTPAPFPVELLVNSVIVGSDDAARAYGVATIRCRDLFHIFDSSRLTPDRVGGTGSCTEDRVRAAREDWSVTIAEHAEMDAGDTSASMRWFGEIRMRGSARTLAEWTESLTSVLLLFAILLDLPLTPDRIYVEDGSRHADYYASWTDRAAPANTAPLFLLGEIDHRFTEVLTLWHDLSEGAQDLVDHIGAYQLFRDRQTLNERVLLLFRCLELFHDSRSRFQSVVRPKAEHRGLVDDVVGALPDAVAAEHASWIRTALLEANRKRLVDQVKDILHDLGPAIADCCHIDDIDRFASVAKSTRNYYTHPTGPTPSGVPEGRALVVLTNRLWFVVRACLLIELGFSRDATAAALKRSGRRHYLLK